MLSIDAQAVIHSGKEKTVFVRTEPGRFAPRKISTGLTLDQGRVQVTSGLAEGERVVISGQFLLDSESRMKEAIQKMLKAEPEPDTDDNFFDDMEPEEDFFKDMG